MNQNIIIIVVVLIFVFCWLNKKKVEGYSSKKVLDDWVPFHNYYLWREYGHDVYDIDRKERYPFDYKQHPYYYRHAKYIPQFYKYGYGHW